MRIRFVSPSWLRARMRIVRPASIASACAMSMALAGCGGGGGGGGVSAQPLVTISAQPSDTHVLDGQGASMTVVANGAASYEWQQNGPNGWTDVPGGVMPTLTLDAVHVADSGEQFRVIVGGSPGSDARVTSSIVTLTVDAVVVAPSLQFASGNQTAWDGQQVSLNVTAQGTTLAYQWQHSDDDGASWSDVVGATGTTLSFVASVSDPQGQYRVVVSNSAGTQTSVPATVKVNAAPAQPLFLFIPVSVTASIGGAATFTAQAVGTPVPSLQWQSSYGSNAAWEDIPGATGGSYTLAAVTAADDGRNFRAVATNANGSTFSNQASLSVPSAPAAPAVSEQPMDAIAGAGSFATFNAHGYGSPTVSYQWQVSTDDGATFTNINGATRDFFQTGVVAMSDSGKRYRVVLANDLGSATSNAATLTVMQMPTLRTYGLGQPYWDPGVTGVSFQASAIGEQLHYQWRTGTNTSGTTTHLADVAGATDATFTLPASADPAINTVCVVVSNPVGSAQACGWPSALTWHVVSPRPTAGSLSAIARVDGQTAVASDNDGAFLRSADGGLTWTTVSDGVYIGNLQNTIAFNGQSGIAVGFDYTLKLSSDGGRHWMESPYESIHWSAATFTSTGTAVRVGVNGRIAWSTDQGHSWTDATTDANTNALSAVAFGASGIGIAVGDAGSIRRSADGGRTWTTVHLGGVAMTSVAIGATGTIVATDPSGVFWRSTDGGLTWTGIPSGIGSAITCVRVMVSGTLLAGTGNGWMLRSTDDGMNWSATYSGAYVSDIVSLDSGVDLAVGSGALLQRSTDDGLTWTSVVTGDRQSLQAIADVDASTAVAVGVSGRIRRTADAGVTWNIVPSPVSINLYGVAFAGGASSANGLAVGASGTILRTGDNGRTWSVVGSWPALGDLHSVTWPSSGVVIAAGDNGMLRSIDGGATWATVAGFTPNSFLTSVAFGDPATGLVGSLQGQIWRTTDGGATWNSVAAKPDVVAIVFPSPTTAIALANDGTSLRSTDGGVTWTTLGAPFGIVGYFSGVTFRDANFGIAVGRYVYQTNDGGLTWTQQMGAEGESLHGVALLGAHTAVAVGETGLIYESTAY